MSLSFFSFVWVLQFLQQCDSACFLFTPWNSHSLQARAPAALPASSLCLCPARLPSSPWAPSPLISLCAPVWRLQMWRCVCVAVTRPPGNETGHRREEERERKTKYRDPKLTWGPGAEVGWAGGSRTSPVPSQCLCWLLRCDSRSARHLGMFSSWLLPLTSCTPVANTV